MEANQTLATLMLSVLLVACGGCKRDDASAKGAKQPPGKTYRYPDAVDVIPKQSGGPQQSGEPALEASPTAFDFGRIFDKKPVHKRFTVSNTSKYRVTLRKVETSCGCTAARPLADGKPVKLPYELAPGQSLDLPVTLDPVGRGGKQDQWIELRTNNRTQPITRIKIEAHILREVGLEIFLWFGAVQHGKAVTKVLTLTGYPPKTFQVTGVESTAPYLTLKVGKRQPPRKAGDPVTFQIAVTLAANAPFGRIEQHVYVKTNSPRFPRKQVFVSAHIRGQINVHPQRLRIRVGQKRKPVATVFLSSRTLRIEVQQVKCSIPYLRWLLHPRRGKNQSVRFEVVEPPAGLTGLVRGTIEITTNSKKRPALSIPVVLDFGQSKKD